MIFCAVLSASSPAPQLFIGSDGWQTPSLVFFFFFDLLVSLRLILGSPFGHMETVHLVKTKATSMLPSIQVVAAYLPAIILTLVKLSRGSMDASFSNVHFAHCYFAIAYLLILV